MHKIFKYGYSQNIVTPEKELNILKYFLNFKINNALLRHHVRMI